MFTQPCFIRKNTPELRKKLEELGYIMGESLNTNKSKGLICTNYGKVFNIICNADISKYDFDCGTNEELFLALSALRDDSDYMQWFVCPKTRTRRMAGCFGQVVGMDGHYQEIVGYEWYRHENKDNALTERLNSMIQMEYEDVEFLPHKATVEEIIEHFKE